MPLPFATPRPADPDAEWLTRVAEGDVAAMRHLHRRYYTRVAAFARRLGLGADRADEIANDTMLAVWRSADRFAAQSAVSTWILGIAYRIAQNTRRRFRREASHVDLDADLPSPQDPALELLWQKRMVAAALATLSLEQRAIVELVYVHGYPQSDVAEVVGCPVGTVKSRLAAARAKMRRSLEGLT